jgi:hypothetical protein
MASLEQWCDLREAIVASLKIRAKARPAPVSRAGGEPRPLRIQRDIARLRHEVILGHDDGTVARPEHVTRDAQARVDDRAVAPMSLADALKLGRLDEAVICGVALLLSFASGNDVRLQVVAS